MLSELRIEDFAIAERVELEFGPGLTVLTGETGAGKSIVVDAVAAILGGRVSSDDVRADRPRALVEASFLKAEATKAVSQAAQFGFEEDPAQAPDDDGLLILSREINAGGRSKCRVNGRLANVSQLKAIGEHLVDIHGQHDHQSLLAPSRHLDLLDALGGDRVSDLSLRVNRLAERRSQLMAEIDRLKETERERARQEDLLRYQIEEINAAGLEEGEDENLEAERARLAHAERLAQGVREAYAALYEGEGAAAIDLVGTAWNILEDLRSYDDNLSGPAEALSEAIVNLREVSRELRTYAEGLEIEPARLEEIEVRLETIAGLKRKYGDGIAEILSFAAEAQKELDSLTSAQDRLTALEEELKTVEAELAHAASQLSTVRREVAEGVSKRIARRLARLNMEAARFQVAIDHVEDPQGILIDGRRIRVSRRGIDRVEFLFSANPGEEPKALSRIASGGEMSRVMLAIKATLAEVDPAATLIFDEVDAGIGGETAERVAETLAELAKTHQVLVVTHLAQIAARADHHFNVEKASSKGRTTVRLKALSGDDRAWEIARMLDGKASETSFTHAKDLLQRAQSAKTAS